MSLMGVAELNPVTPDDDIRTGTRQRSTYCLAKCCDNNWIKLLCIGTSIILCLTAVSPELEALGQSRSVAHIF